MDYTAYIIAAIASLPGLAAVIAQVVKDRKEHVKRKADIEAARRRLEIDAVDVAQESVKLLLDPLNKRIFDLEETGQKCKNRIIEFEALLTSMDVMIKRKDDRIAELETISADKDKTIADMQKEIDELRQRIVVLENGGIK